MNIRWVTLICIVFLVFNCLPEVMAERTFVHPGITSTRSDLDRLKYMVEAQIDPWYSSYQEMVADSKSSYDYTVRGDPSFTVLGRDDGTNYSAWNSDIRAAYYNAIRWYVTGDSRHADKAVEIFNAWTNLTSVTSSGTRALSGGIGYIMIEAAEIIKSTYGGWSESDIQNFKDMLIYPGYSTTEEPAGVSRLYGSFYWQAYQGDSVRHGNQGLAGFRTVMAMGIFMDNEIMYDRALRYIQGLPHRPDDLPYPPGPSTATTIASVGEYADTYNYTTSTAIEDYGFNEVMTNYIWETGQCQESSRDQSHTVFGIGILCAMSEMAWNQGYDLYSHANDRLLLGLEYTTKYNVSNFQSYPDQTTWWVPTVASGEFMQGFNASQRVYSKAISPINIGGFPGNVPVFEMPVGHYIGRGLKPEEEAKWTVRARDYAVDTTGYEDAGHVNEAVGWGALTERRPDYCYGDPISGFTSNSLPMYAMHQLPGTIEAENYDYFTVNGEGRTYHDLTVTNSGGQYRLTDGVDITTCSEGGYALTELEDGEWVTYTVAVPSTSTYDLSIRYAASGSGGKIRLNFAGTDKTGEVTVPSGSPGWQDLTVATGVLLNKGVQSLKVSFSGAFSVFELNTISVDRDANTLVGHWTFDEGTGTVAADSSGHGHDGTVVGANWVAGADGGALNFNGSSSQVIIPPSVFDTISSEITVAMWVYGAASQPLPDSAFYAAEGNNRMVNVHLPYDNSTVYWDAGYSSGYDRINKTATDAEFKGSWSHWVFTKDATAGTMKIYRNGALWQSGTGKTKLITGITAATIGSQIAGAYYTGLIDDVRLYNIALSDQDIKSLYYHYPVHSVTGLTAEAIDASQIDLRWNDASGASAYNLKRSAKSGGPYALLAGGLTSTNRSDSGLSAGTNYYYVVSAVYNGTESGDSAEVSAVPSAPLNPGDVVISSFDVGGTNISMSVTNSGLGYNFQVWASESLADPDWQISSDVWPGNGGALLIEMPMDETPTNRFYKLEAWRQ